ncbi:MAG: glycosyltransferase [Eubacterium sp.]|nr:glycosyltransferase [Eubacterium sp.]
MNLIERNYVFQNLYQECSLEVIFVNDFPQEHIALEEKDTLFVTRLITHERNKGIHAARVTGIENAKGKYIILFDQDDLAKDNWIYSQWHKIEETKLPVCVCNGWLERFRKLSDSRTLENNTRSLEALIRSGNPIMSPGQVIMRKDCIPQEWLSHIQQINGADDFLLWIMMLKKGYQLGINEECLYYHTSARTEDSVDEFHMIQSLKETLQILVDTKILNKDECVMLSQWIALMEAADTYCSWKDTNVMQTIRQMRKNSKIFHVMRNWIDSKNHGKSFSLFFINHQYHSVAIYGMGYIGESLYYELKNSNISVVYAIDKSAIDFREELQIFHPDNELPPVDVMIVTLVEKCEELCDYLAQKAGCPVVTIQRLLLELDMGDEENVSHNF